MSRFKTVLLALKKKAGNLLDSTASSFDRDFVLFNSQVDELDRYTLEFIEDRFEEVSGNILHSLDLLTKYQKVFERDKVRKRLDRKFTSLFLAYGEELDEIKALYEREKQDPPLARNLPPVAGNSKVTPIYTQPLKLIYPNSTLALLAQQSTGASCCWSAARRR